MYRHEVEQLVGLAEQLGTEAAPVDALRRWMRSNVEFVATKKGMSAALALAANASPGLTAYSFDSLTRAVGGLLRRAAEAAGMEPSDFALQAALARAASELSEDYVTRISPEGMARWLQFQASAGSQRPARPRELLDGSSLSTLVQMVGAGIGVTLIPEMAVPVETHSAPVSVARFPDPQPARTIGLIWRKTNPLAGRLAELAEVVREAAEAQGLAARGPVLDPADAP